MRRAEMDLGEDGEVGIWMHSVWLLDDWGNTTDFVGKKGALGSKTRL